MGRSTQLPPQQQGHQQYFFPPPPPGGYTYPPPPPAMQHIPQNNQIIIQQDPNTAAALQQMAQLHQQYFEASQSQTRALKNITSSVSFTSTVCCIPIYDGKDKDAYTEWLQRCKEASFHTGYSFRSALLQRSSQDVANIIRSLDETSHTTDWLSRSCVLSWVSLAQQQPLMNCPAYGNNQAKISWST